MITYYSQFKFDKDSEAHGHQRFLENEMFYILRAKCPTEVRISHLIQFLPTFKWGDLFKFDDFCTLGISENFEENPKYPL